MTENGRIQERFFPASPRFIELSEKPDEVVVI